MLDSAGHETVDPSTIGAGALLANAHWQADAAIAVLLDRRPTIQRSSAVMLETGIALGRSLPVLVAGLTPKRFPALTGLPFVSASLAGAEEQRDLQIKVDLFLEGVRMNVPRHVDSSTPPMMPNRSATRSSPKHGPDLEASVAHLLDGAGAQLLSSEYQSNSGIRPDIAFLVEGLEAQLGLVLVEVVSSSQMGSAGWMKSKGDQLAEYVSRSGAGLGLLIIDGSDTFVGSAYRPLVVTLTAVQLRDQLEHLGLSKMLLQLRNSAIHGRG